MQGETTAEQDHTPAYDARPWLQHYPEGVPPLTELPTGTIWDALETTVAHFGDRTAFIFQGIPMSYRQLGALSERMAAALAAAGVGAGSPVLFLLPNVPHFPVTYYGTLRLGALVAAAPPNSVAREIEHLIRDSGAKIVVTIDLLYEKIADIWEQCGVETVVVGSIADFLPLWMRVVGRLTGRIPRPKAPVQYSARVRSMRRFLRSRRRPPQLSVTPDDVAVLQYTGGTTGTPKAAMLTHRGLLANAVQMRSWFPALRQGEESILAALPFFHVYGVTLVMNAGLILAARTILIPRPVAAEIFAAIARYRPSIFPGVPTLYVAIINDERSRTYDLSSIDVCVSGGAPLPAEVKREFERITGGHLYEGYGLSEASPVTHAEPFDGRTRSGSMGLPLPNTDARIVDDHGCAVPVNEVGELVVRGPQIMMGYWHRCEETDEVLQDGWLRTGDLARMDEDGWFYIVDRKKDLIITGGENIYPREVEEVLFRHPDVQQVAVVGVPHGYGGEIAKAFVVPRPGASLTRRDIIEFASQNLAKHKVPRDVEFRDELPVSAGLKVLRRVLADEERRKQAKQPPRRRGRSRCGEPEA